MKNGWVPDSEIILDWECQTFLPGESIRNLPKIQ